MVKAKTRDRVLEISRRLNYQPNIYARPLTPNRAYLIGVIVPNLSEDRKGEVWHRFKRSGGGWLRNLDQQVENLDLFSKRL